MRDRELTAFAEPRLNLRAVAQEGVDHRVPPGAVPEAHFPQHAFALKTDAFQGLLLGDVA
jgi:hypothetical protein